MYQNVKRMDIENLITDVLEMKGLNASWLKMNLYLVDMSAMPIIRKELKELLSFYFCLEMPPSSD